LSAIRHANAQNLACLNGSRRHHQPDQRRTQHRDEQRSVENDRFDPCRAELQDDL
jgi:hypothetical protein